MKHTKGRHKLPASILPPFANHMLKKMCERDGKDLKKTIKKINQLKSL